MATIIYAYKRALTWVEMDPFGTVSQEEAEKLADEWASEMKRRLSDATDGMLSYIAWYGAIYVDVKYLNDEDLKNFDIDEWWDQTSDAVITYLWDKFDEDKRRLPDSG